MTYAESAQNKRHMKQRREMALPERMDALEQDVMHDTHLKVERLEARIADLERQLGSKERTLDSREALFGCAHRLDGPCVRCINDADRELLRERRESRKAETAKPPKRA